MHPIEIPDALDDSTLLTIEELCAMARPEAREVYQRDSAPRIWRYNGTGRLCTTVREVHRSRATAVNLAEEVKAHD